MFCLSSTAWEFPSNSTAWRTLGGPIELVRSGDSGLDLTTNLLCTPVSVDLTEPVSTNPLLVIAMHLLLKQPLMKVLLKHEVGAS